MATKPTPPELLGIAERHERRLTARERRSVIAFLDESRFEKTHKDKRTGYALAALFGVSETQIRNDRKRIAADTVAAMTPDQAMSFVYRHLQRNEQLIRAAEQGMDTQPAGSVGERAYIELLNRLSEDHFKALQGVGLVAKNLGSLTVTEECWQAVAIDDVQSVNKLTPGEIDELLKKPPEPAPST